MSIWLFALVCVLAVVVIFYITPLYTSFGSYDFWPEFLIRFGAFVIVMLVSLAVYFSYKTSIWMEENHCVKTQETREVTYFISVVSGNTTILVPQTSTEHLYQCDNQKTIWWN